MLACERETRLRVVKTFLAYAGCFPLSGGVAPNAIRSKASLVFVLVTGAAAWRDSQPRAIQILAPQQSPRLAGDMLRCMTCPATHAHVLTIERITGLRVVETGRSRIPMDHLEVLAVVI